MKSTGWNRGLLAGLALLAAGCFPIELDVSTDGRLLVPRREGFFAYHPEKDSVTKVAESDGQPAFAVWSPDDRTLLTAGQSGGGMMGGQTEFRLVPVGGGEARTLHTGRNASYCSWSPDGRYIAITQQAQEARPPLEQQMPEIHLYDLEEDGSRVVIGNVGRTHDWLPDSSGLVVFQAEEKLEKGNMFKGRLGIVPVAGEAAFQPLARAMGSEIEFDVAPDGARVLFCAVAAGPLGAELNVGDQPSQAKPQLCQVNIADQGFSAIWPNIKLALHSPDGERVLVATEGESGTLQLHVADAGLTGYESVASDAAGQAGGMGNSVTVYPGWIDADTIFYIAQRAVYGTAGKNLVLTLVEADGSGRRPVQHHLDEAAFTAAE